MSRRFALFLIAFVLFESASNSQELPLRRYTTADGLPSNGVSCVKRDSRGFLWFCTGEGLSRFDGYSFTNYGTDQGLPDRFVTGFLETRSGDMWVGTRRGLARFDAKPQSETKVLSAYGPFENADARINSLLEDRKGRIWVATSGGLFELLESSGTWHLHRVDLPACDKEPTNTLAQDSAGNLWIGMGSAYSRTTLCRRQPDGRTELFTNPFLSRNEITSIFVDSEKRIWVSTFTGLALLSSSPVPNGAFVARVFTKKDGLRHDVVTSIFQSSDGRLWIGGSGGLFEVAVSGSVVNFKNVGSAEQGFGPVDTEDLDGNFWMGNRRLTTHGFVHYGTAEGLRTTEIRSIFDGSDGRIYVVSELHGRYINRFDGKGFTGVAPLVPGHGPEWDWGGWGWGQIHFQDHLGEWWVPTSVGLLRYPQVSRLEDLASTPPIAIYKKRDGLSGNDIFRLYEDHHGDIWVSTWANSGLTRWDRASARFYSIGSDERWHHCLPTSFREDRAGNLWMGCWEHNLIRYRNGQTDVFEETDGFPGGSVLSLYIDHAGRLWASTTRGGLVRIDHPEGDKPQFRVYTTKDGLSSNNVRSVNEDLQGRIYAWTGVALDRLEPESGAVVHYTTSEGVPESGGDSEIFRDRQGSLWFAYPGISRLDPLPMTAHPSNLPIYVKGIRIRGVALPLSELGETQVSGLVFQPSQNNLQIEFGGLNFHIGEVLRYQYKFDGTNQDWTPPSDLRTVNYAELRPGNYRFSVRAINSRGEVSSSPATVSFRILAPIWARWWFLTLVAAVAGLVAYQLYQYRLNSLLELERVRTRIASDLHDDIGSGLTQIAILSEVARQSENMGSGKEVLSRMGDLSRELVDGMGEIVWALNPQRDQVADLVQRMRRFASDVLVARGIEFEFHAPASDLDLPVRSDVRRNLYLIFKEAINNSIRHSSCTRASITLSVDKNELKLSLADNGKGLDGVSSGNGRGAGRGLSSMKERAAELGGVLEITSSPGQGTLVSLVVPFSHRAIRVRKITT